TMYRIYGTERCRLSPEECLFTMPVERTETCLEVVLPAELYRDGCEMIEIGWIESFRQPAPTPNSRLQKLAEEFDDLQELAEPAAAAPTGPSQNL
ncbi:MAG: hypothetical protein ACOC93_05620, partial [Planctomycetota bacterium]